MAKKKNAKRRGAHEIREHIQSGYAPQAVVIVVVPSHTKKKDRTSDQSTVAGKGMKLLARLFGGATQFNAQRGVYKSKGSQRLLWDNPILLESYADREILNDIKRLGPLIDFVKQMGRDLEQEAVALVIDGTMHVFEDFSGAPEVRLI